MMRGAKARKEVGQTANAHAAQRNVRAAETGRAENWCGEFLQSGVRLAGNGLSLQLFL